MWYLICLSHSLTHSQTTVARLEIKKSSTWPPFYDTTIKLTTFWSFNECGTLYLGAIHLPFSCSPSCRNHIKVLISCPYLDATTLFKAFVFTATCIVILEPVTCYTYSIHPVFDMFCNIHPSKKQQR